jgi:hypothetical protein
MYLTLEKGGRRDEVKRLNELPIPFGKWATAYCGQRYGFEYRLSQIRSSSQDE